MPARLAAALVLLALTAGALAYRRPPWRRLAGVLAALACIDVARLATAPRALTMAAPWWSLDVALFAAWSVAMGAALVDSVSGFGYPLRLIGHERLRHLARGSVLRLRGGLQDRDGGGVVPQVPQPRQGDRAHGGGNGGGARGGDGEGHRDGAWDAGLRGGRVAFCGAVVAICYPLALGIARPWLPRLAYLGALVAARLVVAWLWARAWRRLLAEPARAPAVAALVLAAGDFAALAAWLALPPAWEVAQGVTAASYAATGCVVVWAAVRR